MEADLQSSLQLQINECCDNFKQDLTCKIMASLSEAVASLAPSLLSFCPNDDEGSFSGVNYRKPSRAKPVGLTKKELKSRMSNSNTEVYSCPGSNNSDDDLQGNGDSTLESRDYPSTSITLFRKPAGSKEKTSHFDALKLMESATSIESMSTSEILGKSSSDSIVLFDGSLGGVKKYTKTPQKPVASKPAWNFKITKPKSTPKAKQQSLAFNTRAKPLTKPKVKPAQTTAPLRKPNARCDPAPKVATNTKLSYRDVVKNNVKDTKVVKAVKPVKPVEKKVMKVMPVKIVKEVKPVKLAKFVKPVKPVKVAKFVKPVQPVKPATAVKSFATTKAVKTVKPTKAMKPFVATGKVKPMKPLKPVKPAKAFSHIVSKYGKKQLAGVKPVITKAVPAPAAAYPGPQARKAISLSESLSSSLMQEQLTPLKKRSSLQCLAIKPDVIPGAKKPAVTPASAAKLSLEAATAATKPKAAPKRKQSLNIIERNRAKITEMSKKIRDKKSAADSTVKVPLLKSYVGKNRRPVIKKPTESGEDKNVKVTVISRTNRPKTTPSAPPAEAKPVALKTSEKNHDKNVKVTVVSRTSRPKTMPSASPVEAKPVALKPSENNDDKNVKVTVVSRTSRPKTTPSASPVEAKPVALKPSENNDDTNVKITVVSRTSRPKTMPSAPPAEAEPVVLKPSLSASDVSHPDVRTKTDSPPPMGAPHMKDLILPVTPAEESELLAEAWALDQQAAEESAPAVPDVQAVPELQDVPEVNEEPATVTTPDAEAPAAEAAQTADAEVSEAQEAAALTAPAAVEADETVITSPAAAAAAVPEAPAASVTLPRSRSREVVNMLPTYPDAEVSGGMMTDPSGVKYVVKTRVLRQGVTAEYLGMIRKQEEEDALAEAEEHMESPTMKTACGTNACDMGAGETY